ncbi:MAG: PAS domain-containing protein, partial [Phycisphaerae bacterium]
MSAGERSNYVRMLLGAVTVAATAAAVELFSRGVTFIPNPGIFLLLAIAIAGFLWGLAAAMAGVPVAIAAALYAYADPGAWMRYTPGNLVRVIVFSVAAPLAALIVGVLKARAERSLSASEGRYAALFQATPDAVYVQQDERIAYANDAAHDLFGASPDGPPARRLVGCPIWERIHPDSHARVRGRLLAVTGGTGDVPS